MTTEPVRDQYRSRVYRAEKITSHVVLGTYWVQTIPDDEIGTYLNNVLSDPRVVARWGRIRYKVRLGKRGNSAYANMETRTIVLSKNTRNPITVLHEAAHLMASFATGQPDHGPAFLAAYRFLIRIGLGEDAARIFTASITAGGLTISDTHLPPVRDTSRSKKAAVQHDPLPGFTADQIATAAEVLATAARSGLFGEAGDDKRRQAFAMARTLNSHKKGRPSVDAPALPESVTISTADLLAVDTPEQVAGLLLSAVKEATNDRPRLGGRKPFVPNSVAAAKKVTKKTPAKKTVKPTPATASKPTPSKTTGSAKATAKKKTPAKGAAPRKARIIK